MKAISWNVNGLRACLQKGFLDFFQAEDADFFCLQETKLQEGQVALELPGYHQFWNYAQKKGYSGTAIFSKLPPLSVSYGLGIPELDTEGRVITLEFDNFYLVTCYTPNAQQALARLDFRLEWEKAFSQYLVGLDQKKPVVVCGDLNVAHQEIDLKNPAANRGNAGFSDEEMEMMEEEMDLLGGCSVQDYIRDCVLKKHAFLPSINQEAWSSLARPLANLNQIARHLNSGGKPGVDAVMSAISQVKSALTDVRDLLIGVSCDDNEENGG